MNNCISFTPTIQKSLQSKNNLAKWDDAIKYFDNKDYRNSIYAVFDYLDENILQHYTNADKTKFVIPQGSAVVLIEMEGETISIRVSFVKLPAEKQLPILRKCTEINFNNMGLPQLLLDGDTLVLSYKMPVELCEPYKLYDVLRDIAINADKYDDEFVDKFGATRIMEPQITPYSEQELQTIRETVINIATEALNYAAYFESKRDAVLTSDALFIGINRIKYYAAPTGLTCNKLNDAIDTFFDRAYDINSKIKTMRTALEGIKNMSVQESQAAFYISYQLIPVKANASRGYLKDWIAGQYQDAESMFNKENFTTAVSYSLYTLYLILADFNIDKHSSQAIEYSLRKAADKPWAEAAPILLKVLRFFYVNEKEIFDMEKDNSFQESIFGENQMKSINKMVDQYKSRIGNFMKGIMNKN